jgi:hypothetical protein
MNTNEHESNKGASQSYFDDDTHDEALAARAAALDHRASAFL